MNSASMSRPVRLTFIGLVFALLVSLFMVAMSRAQHVDKVQNIANNFSHQNLICTAYFLFVSQCLANKDAKDPLASRYRANADTALKRGIEMGKLADVSDKALSAKVELAVEEMKLDTENNCVNISVLFKKHARSCKSTLEDGPDALSAQINKLGVK